MAAATTETSRPAPGMRIADGRYELVRPLGDGAIGVVWEDMEGTTGPSSSGRST